MSERELSIIVGARSRLHKKPKVARAQDAIAKRWRMIATSSPEASSSSEVIPLLDGWIRRLERQAGAGSAPNP